jgi:hypothetical protein
MSLASFDTVLPLPSRRTGVRRRGSAASQRALFLAGIVLATVGGFALTGNEAVSQAAAQAGEDLTRLLRAMAALKAAIILPAAAAIVWRLGAPARLEVLAGYALAGMSMSVSLGLIWHMAHVSAGAFLMHAGLITTLVMLFRDKAVGERLSGLLKTRLRA